MDAAGTSRITAVGQTGGQTGGQTAGQAVVGTGRAWLDTVATDATPTPLPASAALATPTMSG